MKNKKEHFLSLGQIELSDLERDVKIDTDCISVLPTRDFMMFNGSTFPISLGRETSIATAEKAAAEHTPIAILCQREPSTESPEIPDDLYEYGVAAIVLKVFDLPDDQKLPSFMPQKKFA